MKNKCKILGRMTKKLRQGNVENKEESRIKFMGGPLWAIKTLGKKSPKSKNDCFYVGIFRGDKVTESNFKGLKRYLRNGCKTSYWTKPIDGTWPNPYIKTKFHRRRERKFLSIKFMKEISEELEDFILC